MTTTDPTPVTLTPAQFADHLRWLLGNYNFEFDDLEAVADAYSTADGAVIEVNVQTRIPDTREGGSQRFTLTVAEVDDPAEVSTSSRWWVSWYGSGPFEYHGPWWVTGSGAGGTTFCAAVIAADEDAAREVIVSAHDDPPVSLAWRFVKPRAGGWSPFSDRFERAEWMRWPD